MPETENKTAENNKETTETRTPTSKCERCGQCCRTQPIPVSILDIDAISHHMMVTPSEFIEKYLKLINHKDCGKTYIFKESPCPFQKGDECSIHDHKPTTCTTTPCMKDENNQKIARDYGFTTLQFLDCTPDEIITHMLNTEYTEKYLEKNSKYDSNQFAKHLKKIRKDLGDENLKKHLLENIVSLAVHPAYRDQIITKIRQHH